MPDKSYYDLDRLIATGKQLSETFALGRGLILGSAAVLSQWAHRDCRQQDGLVHVMLDKDASGAISAQANTNDIVHIDVFHYPAEIYISDIAQRISGALLWYLRVSGIEKDFSLHNSSSLSLARNIQISTAFCHGTVLGPYRQAHHCDTNRDSHVHILAKLPPQYYPFIQCIVDETERSLSSQGVKLRPVKQIIHIHPVRNDWSFQSLFGAFRI